MKYGYIKYIDSLVDLYKSGFNRRELHKTKPPTEGVRMQVNITGVLIVLLCSKKYRSRLLAVVGPRDTVLALFS